MMKTEIKEFEDKLINLIKDKNKEFNSPPIGLIVNERVAELFKNYFLFNPDILQTQTKFNNLISYGTLYLAEFNLKIYVEKEREIIEITVLYPQNEYKFPYIFSYN